MRIRILVAILGAITLASCGGSGKSGSSPAPAATITGYSVSPASASVTVGLTQNYVARANYSDGTSQAVSATWSSSNPAQATIDAATGVATGVAAGGPVTITAQIGGHSPTAQLMVNAPVLTTIVVNPGSATQPAGIAQQFTALGIWSDHSTQDITSQVSWDTSDHTLTAISPSGSATGLAPTSPAGVTVSASLGGLTGSATFIVSAATLTSVSAAPDLAVIPVGANQQFQAAGTFSDHTTADITSLVNWTSSSLPVATVGLNTGLAVGISPGSANIDAAFPGASSDSSSLMVLNAALVGISVLPHSSSIAVGGQQQFSVLGTYTDGSTQDITASAAWSSSDLGIASISATGLAIPVAPGVTDITANFGGFSDTANLTVTAAHLTAIAVTPAIPTVGIRATVPFTATGQFDDGSTEDLTNEVTWTSSNASVATISAAGVATTTGMGQATIAAALNGISGSTRLTVTAATLLRIFILPANLDPTTLGPSPAQPALTMPMHSTQQLIAVGFYTDHTFRTLAGVNWGSSKPSIAIVTGSGLLRSKNKAQTAVITVKWNGNSATANLSVSSLQVKTLAITPVNPTVAAGTGLQFTAQATLTNGTAQDVTNAVRWTTSNYQQAVVSRSGFASAVSAGTPTITATFYNADGTTTTAATTLTISAAHLTGLSVQPASGNGTIALGTSQQFIATGAFDDGSSQDLTALTSWSSSDIGVAVMSKLKGLAVSAGQGTATIHGSFGGQAGSSQLTVTAP